MASIPRQRYPEFSPTYPAAFEPQDVVKPEIQMGYNPADHYRKTHAEMLGAIGTDEYGEQLDVLLGLRKQYPELLAEERLI